MADGRSGALVVRGGTVVDVEAGVARRGDVLVVDGRIAEVAERVAAPGGAAELDASGRYVVPGLIDCHVHVTAGSADLGAVAESSPYYVAAQASAVLRGMLRRGFTTVRDVGGADFGVAAAVEDGLWEGPRVVFGGKALSPTGGHADLRGPGRTALDQHACCPGLGRVCDGVDEVRRAARDQLRTGAHHVKVMLSGGVASPTDRIDSLQFSADEVAAVVEEATNANRYATGHAYTAAAVNRGLALGVRCIEHGNLIDDSSVALFVEKGAYLVPTLVTYEYLRREGAAAGLPKASQDKVGVVLDAGLEALERAWKGGVKIAFGTDLLGSMHRHQSDEFRIRAEVQPPAEILRSATLVGAELIGRAGELGTIAPGAVGDLLLVDGDPLTDATVLAEPDRHLRAVVTAGRVAWAG
ncbi:MAG TPA: amidohydrolase family protein [Pseudonocardia sp.]|jgi:imidazolonepropionase-like amidohydrolase|uniref:metal-dependent hydrolase family protein n=1 Tax=Pseudonocardia sp. TaxID=60912 RepID=UPI002B4B81C3|nr:amidohydrolase family protein [Pseudonocardia sp.]HLU56061.1 amidohydrolase family protein [Pseudonocardia sp.]